MTDPTRDARERFETRLIAELLARELITHAGLELALSQQMALGGHLSTNLWELGMVEGGALSALSASLLGVREPNPDELERIPSPVLRVLPLEFVEKTRVLPLAIRRNVLEVVTAEPWDHLRLGEAAMHAGYPVQPAFVAEVPLLRLLSRYYRLPTPARFRLDLPARPVARAPDTMPWEELPELPGDIATVVTSGPLIHPPQTPPAEVRPPPLVPISKLDEAYAALEAAEDRNAVGSVLARFALSRGKRVLLLAHRAGQWSGWLAAGERVDSNKVSKLMIPAEAGTAFGLVGETGAHYIGRLRHHPVHVAFLATLDKIWPGTVALLPVHFRGRLVMGIYLDAGVADVPTDLAELLLLAQRVPWVLERLLKRRMAAIA